MNLDTKQAVQLAKEWVADQFASEGVEGVGLEEIKFNNGYWEITIGFSRRWEGQGFLAATPGGRLRIYKVVVISDERREVIEMRNREVA